ncbi:MAG TPA: gliding motility-associated C-terminal domain-containing protein [Flavisolibacter sp.]|nr:gliding motility-associated C-terminal domain-containing protein [Flavisolibacter sp.]
MQDFLHFCQGYALCLSNQSMFACKNYYNSFVRRALFVFLFTVLYLSPMCQGITGCTDSSFHLRYQQPANDTLWTTKQIPARDGGRIAISQAHSDAPVLSKAITRFAPDGKVQWSKKINGGVAPLNDFDLQAICEAGNGNVAAAGSMNNGTPTSYFVQFLDQSGDLLAQKAIGFAGSGNGNEVAAPLILQKGTDSMLFVFWHAGGGNSINEKLFLVSTDNAGNIGHTSLIKAPIGAGIGIHSLQIKNGWIENNKLSLFGVGITLDRCKYGYVDVPAFLLLEFDLPSFQLLKRRDYCPKFSGSATTGAYQVGYAIGSQGKEVNVFFQANGNIVFTRTYRGLENTASGLVNQLFSVSTFDAAFNHLKTECITIPAALLNTETAQELYVDAKGYRHISFYDFQRQQLYYAVADSNSNFLLQKRLSLAGGSPYLLLPRNGLLPDGLFTSVNLVTKVNNASTINYLGIRPEDTASACFGVNETFLSVMSDPLTELNWAGQFIAETAMLVSTTTNFSITDYAILQQDICIVKRICDTIKIFAQGNVCDLSQPVRLTAYKNSLCPGKVIFNFDTSAVISFSQPNDTTLLLHFEKSWRGTIYASLANCPGVKDSFTLSVHAPMARFSIGEDTIFCPGSTYQIKAPPNLSMYQWQDGSSNSSFTAIGPGLYYVTAADVCGRKYADTLTIRPLNAVLSAGRDTTICRSEQLALHASQGFTNYNWSPTDYLSATSLNTVMVSPDVTTTYFVSATTLTGCRLTDTVIVSVRECPVYFYVPTAFTPNNDGKNDLFKPSISGTVISYEFYVYNRWGEEVFHTKNRNAGWNGTIRGVSQPGNAFVWMCRYQFQNQKTQIRKGTVVLIR